MHPVETIYHAAGHPVTYGNVPGTCRITGKKSTGLSFCKWVKLTFTDFSYLHPGDIVSNAALFCFDEKSELMQRMTERDKPQKFRTYSHFVTASGEWRIFTKANKVEMFSLLTAKNAPRIAVMSDSGQKHLVFKHRIGMWQLEENNIQPDIDLLSRIHGDMQELLLLGFSQKEVVSGNYAYHRIAKAGTLKWKGLESRISPHRGTGIFDVSAWLLFHPEKDRK